MDLFIKGVRAKRGSDVRMRVVGVARFTSARSAVPPAWMSSLLAAARSGFAFVPEKASDPPHCQRETALVHRGGEGKGKDQPLEG